MDAQFIPDPGIELRDLDLAKKIAETLHQHYPGHLWAVDVSHRNGTASIRNLRISGKMGFRIFIDDLDHDPGMKLVMRGGGELLERAKAARGRYNAANFPHLKRLGHD